MAECSLIGSFPWQVNHILYSNRSAAYIKLEQFEKALADALKAKELDPSWPKVSYSYTKCLFLATCDILLVGLTINVR